MNAISLFSGIGGFDLALERAGVDVMLQSEIEPHCQKLLAKRFPGTELVPDVHDVRDRTTDLIVGGFPCQDISVAGERRGLAGDRSGLWYEFARILDESRPEWCLIENVPGLLSSNGGRDMGAVLGSLADLGYGFAYRVLDAQNFGVPQRRRRVFIVGCLGDARRAGEVLFEPEGGGGDSPTSGETRKDIAPTLAARTRGCGFPGTDEALDGYVIPAETTTVNALTRSGLGGGGPDDNLAQAGHLIPQTFDWQVAGSERTWIHDKPGGPARSLTANKTLAVHHVEVYQCHGSNVGPMGTLRAGNGDLTGGVPFVAVPAVAGTLSARMAKRPNQNSVVDNDGDGHLVAFHVTQDPITIETRWPTMGTGNKQGCSTLGVATNLGVRKLMPIECERLQGFADGWTEGFPDTHRYRMLGNAVAVPCVQWIVDRLVAAA